MDEYTKSQIVNIAGIFISLVSLFIAVYGQFKDPKTGIIFFLGILIFVALYFIISYPIMKLIRGLNQVKKNGITLFEIRKDLNNLKDKINVITDYSKLNARISFLENNLKMKNKKAQIDPRWIIILIILILLFLYLRSKGIS